ncbi:DNA-3-methyladenine glycosylase family protein [Sphingosinicella microcystinivorans]|uniref:DNA-3-methyladenine glycosylase II n=1 Tax=Sphingosinicella microcystinivorans TaxID=335406 RepID=A0AAD1D8T7_SPHMI|nr:DNA-3-methyladenine glycosylase [Sphingosinicella microcystinivorans]RKS87910.1 DNA-3-methyladenine glycosylase II [Sphingosinicella microcystinivorans]BBE35719.1 DNA-3-methyladenine glycosidase [Sphingosinicella microcystinivorans]
MGLSAEALRDGIDAIAARDEHVAAALVRAGYPEPRIRARGYETLLRTIVGQQVSVGAANSIWNKLSAAIGDIADPRALLARSFDDLRGAGLSRQKIGYAQSLAGLSASGEIDFANLPDDDEAAIALLSAVKGIGRWSAEIYLLFAEGRPDIWPAGDLAVQIEVGRIKGLAERPSERVTRELAELWRPHRGAAAVFMWHHYKTEVL